MEVVAEAYRTRDPNFKVQAVQNLGTTGGLKALVAKAIDLAVLGRDLKTDEQAQGLIAFEYGRTPLVLGTSRTDLKSLNLQEIADLFAGRVLHWTDGSPVRLVLRPPNDSDTVLMSAWSPAIKEAMALAHARPGMVLASTDQQSADQLERLPGSLGTTTLAMILAKSRDIRALTINGAAPSDKTYPYYKRMYLALRSSDAGHATRFVDFLRSGEGRAALERLGHLVPQK